MSLYANKLPFPHGKIGFIIIVPSNSRHNSGLVIRLALIEKSRGADSKQRQWNLLLYQKNLNYSSSHGAMNPYQSLCLDVARPGLLTLNLDLNGRWSIDWSICHTALKYLSHLPPWLFPGRYNHRTRSPRFHHLSVSIEKLCLQYPSADLELFLLKSCMHDFQVQIWNPRHWNPFSKYPLQWLQKVTNMYMEEQRIAG